MHNVSLIRIVIFIHTWKQIYPIKICNNKKNERKTEEQQRLKKKTWPFIAFKKYMSMREGRIKENDGGGEFNYDTMQELL
jgi:hypothetical protein